LDNPIICVDDSNVFFVEIPGLHWKVFVRSAIRVGISIWSSNPRNRYLLSHQCIDVIKLFHFMIVLQPQNEEHKPKKTFKSKKVYFQFFFVLFVESFCRLI
jgi:hypothetical protein